MTENYLQAFLVGFFASVGTMFYIGKAFHRANHPSDIHVELLFPLIGIALGLANMLNLYTKHNYTLPIGVAVAILFSSYGIS